LGTSAQKDTPKKKGKTRKTKIIGRPRTSKAAAPNTQRGTQYGTSETRRNSDKKICSIIKLRKEEAKVSQGDGAAPVDESRGFFPPLPISMSLSVPFFEAAPEILATILPGMSAKRAVTSVGDWYNRPKIMPT